MKLLRSYRLDPTAFILGLIPFIVLFGAWQILVDAGVLNAFIVSSPAKVFAALWQQITDGIVTKALATTMVEFLVGFGLAVVVGIPVGLLMGWYRRLGYLLEPLVWLLYSSPVIALYPIFTLMFGLGKGAVMAITFVLSVGPITINAARGIKEIDPLLIRTARSFCASDRQIFMKIGLPGSTPMIMAGLRIGVGHALIGVVIGEFFAGVSGIGYQITSDGDLFQTPQMIALVLVVAFLGVVLTQIVNLIERRVDSWRPAE